jgi:hypothetical protein
MSPELAFTLCNAAVLPGWLLLIFSRRTWPSELFCPFVLPGTLAIGYVALLVSQWGRMDGGFSSLAEVAALFENRYALLAGWIHYLAFDLFVGSWEVRDARRLGVSRWLLIPCLVLTLFFGPAGLLSYLLVRWRAARTRGARAMV